MSKSEAKNDPSIPSSDERRQILLHLDASLIKDLKKAAVDLDRSASAIANEAIDGWLKDRALRKGADDN
ncbi:hypothetical protein [Microvirga tunisiensis]|uniref:CopG family transcriptional regulator n=1 Tax=Microvirga tunisiensis TaxID=2108360 RepID=A0A5N7MCT2_9HYPH|nr:hypothetical protein [Microvirga tunisiensis]MPR06293.1 hypothetical protein [Microvirga tunisiensis]MPR24079.1 hypothetical protein [Microvirga tunisiensis]